MSSGNGHVDRRAEMTHPAGQRQEAPARPQTSHEANHDHELKKALAIAEKRAEDAATREQDALRKLRMLETDSRAEINRLRHEAADKAPNAARMAATREAAAASEKAQNAEAWAHRAEERANKAQSKLQEAKDELDNLEQNNRAISNRLEQSEADVRQLLDQLTREKVDGKWNPPPDDDIRQELQALHTRIKTWAKNWAVGALKLDQLEPDLLQQFLKYMSQFVQFTPDGALPPSIGKPVSRMVDKIPALLLNAALAHEIHAAFFKNSFFIVPKHSKALQEIFGQVVKANPRDAYTWRCSLWRLFHPPQTRHSTEEDVHVNQDSNTRVRAYCDQTISGFLQGSAAVLLASLPSELDRKVRTDDLWTILLDAAYIAKRLWTQRLHLESFDLEDFQQRKLVFNNSSPLMQAHPFSKVDYEDPVHNGRRIVVVTRPGLLGYDEDDNKGPSGPPYRVFAKAIVWLEEAAPPR